MSSRLPIDSELDRALADEFSAYLGDMSSKFIKPIDEASARNQREVDRLAASIHDFTGNVQRLVSDHQKTQINEHEAFLTKLREASTEIKVAANSVIKGHEETRSALLASVKDVRILVEQAISDNNAYVAAIENRLTAGLGTLNAGLKPLVKATIDSTSKMLLAAVNGAVRNLKEQMPAEFEKTVTRLSDEQSVAMQRSESRIKLLIFLSASQMVLLAILALRVLL